MVYIVILVIIGAGILATMALRSLADIDPKHTTAGAMSDLHGISDRALAVRKWILHSQLHEAERLALADELLLISDDVKNAADRLMVAVFIDARLIRPGGTLF